ncbi:hypothetical protein CEXT_86101 [Caerostris extrusa]|uniref:Uncharacterized protein n=1 Tax=Caerostris extrusa TaxID=172846 RepID=A0AAV4SDC9_CAEEX|nr:hypothetical protein CEXT_86101 [Caerostris extrusa]
MGFERDSVSFPEAFLTNARIDLSQRSNGHSSLHLIELILNNFLANASLWISDKAQKLQLTKSPSGTALKDIFFCPGLYGAAESHKLALGSIRVLRSLLDILEFEWAFEKASVSFPAGFLTNARIDLSQCDWEDMA